MHPARQLGILHAIHGRTLRKQAKIGDVFPAAGKKLVNLINWLAPSLAAKAHKGTPRAVHKRLSAIGAGGIGAGLGVATWPFQNWSDESASKTPDRPAQLDQLTQLSRMELPELPYEIPKPISKNEQEQT